MASIPELKSYFRKFDVRYGDADVDIPKTTRRASVLIPLLLVQGEWHVLVTVRSRSLRRSAGVVVFPGGFQEPTDVDGVDTALREAKEEIGLKPNDVDIIAVLPLTMVEGGICLTPVLAVIPTDFRPVLNKAEVVKVFDLPLSRFLKDDVEIKTWRLYDDEVFSHTFTDIIDGETVLTSGSVSAFCMLIAVVVLQSPRLVSLKPNSFLDKDTAFAHHTEFVRQFFAKKNNLSKL
ncbi:peroxisomal coenzyme A diphosphatase NUDT7-like isoform X4 [Pecten maximus]|uniref:peroxisomal coenzyme A diphosphatase NUDT7-like isoform X4 n=1 Tax=Pecten maximus TaxID=6579 RepID=UPI001458CF12|nr:peroxisomal coenzyme A diphosphatase NUDT7-like isoform X4 [Pecten maximus]XP_033754118.1 peroxisomal coenzyme A diphosphatase NUDT7-like isoform X4 [Pecten maximus]